MKTQEILTPNALEHYFLLKCFHRLFAQLKLSSQSLFALTAWLVHSISAKVEEYSRYVNCWLTYDLELLNALSVTFGFQFLAFKHNQAASEDVP